MNLLEQKMVLAATGFLDRLRKSEHDIGTGVSGRGTFVEEIAGVRLLASFARVQPSAMCMQAQKQLLAIEAEAEELLERVAAVRA